MELKCRLRLDRDALIELIGRDYIAYGRWDRVFGAWQWQQDGAAWRHVVPCFRLFDRAGTPIRAVDPPPRHDWEDWGLESFFYGSDHSLELAEQSLSQEQRIFIEYSELVPADLRSLAAHIEHPANQWLLLAALWAQPNLSDMLRDEFDTAGNAYVEACLLLRAFLALSPNAIASFLHEALTQPRHQFLSALTGLSVNRGGVALVGRLQRLDMLHKKSIQRMLTKLNEPHLRAILAHRRTISVELLAYLDVMTPPFAKARCLPEALPDLETNGDDSSEVSEDDFFSSIWPYDPAQQAIEAFRGAIAIYGALTCENARKSADSLIRSIRCPRDLLVRFQELDLRHLRWNSAPWPGDARFRPIGDYRTLRATAFKFQNCARDRLPRLLDGRCALYLASGTPSALLELCRDNPTSPWRFGDFATMPVAGLEADMSATIRGIFAESFAVATGQVVAGSLNPS
jgi:DNA-binding phage protein